MSHGLELNPGLNARAQAENDALRRTAQRQQSPPKLAAPMPFGMVIDATPLLQLAYKVRRGKWWIARPDLMLLDPNPESTYTWQPFDGKRANRTRAKIRQGQYRPVLVGELQPDTPAEIETAEGPDMPPVTGDAEKDADRKKFMRVRDGDCELYEVHAEAAKELYVAPVALSIIRTTGALNNGVVDDGSGGVGGDLRTAVERERGVEVDIRQQRA